MSASAIPAAAIAAAASEVAALLRIDATAEGPLIARLVASAITLGEAFLGSALIVRGHDEVVPASGAWRALAAMPVTAIAGVTALPAGQAPAVLAMGDYALDIDADGRGWVRVIRPGAAALVAVDYNAGLAATWDALPPPIAQGVVALAAHLFDDRQGTAMPPAAVSALWRPFRRMRLASAEQRA